MAGVFKHLSPTPTWDPGMIQKPTCAECQGVNSNQATPVDSLIFTDIHGMIVDSWQGAHGHRHIERTIFLLRTCDDVSAYKFAGLQFFHPLVLSLNSLTTVTPKIRPKDRSPVALPHCGQVLWSKDVSGERRGSGCCSRWSIQAEEIIWKCWSSPMFDYQRVAISLWRGHILLCSTTTIGAKGIDPHNFTSLMFVLYMECCFWRELWFFRLFFFLNFCFPASLVLCFLLLMLFFLYLLLASPLFCFSAFCFSASLPFPASLLLCLSASSPICFSAVFCFSASQAKINPKMHNINTH